MIKKVDFYLLLLVFLIAFFLRLYNFTDSFGFYGDQGEDLLAANKWIQTGIPPLVGITTSLGDFHMGPLYYYLITPFVFLLNGQSIAPVYLFLASNLALVIISYLFLMKHVNREAAFIFSFLVAINPHIIFLAKGAYSPNLAVPFSIFILFCLFQFFKSKKYIYLFLTYLWVGAGLQMHYTFIANLISILLMIIAFKFRILLKPKFYMYSIVGFLAPLVPFIVGQFYLNFTDFRNLFDYILEDKNNVIMLSSFYYKLLFPFEIFFPLDNLPWYLGFLARPFFILSFAFFTFISLTKNTFTQFSRVILVFYLAGVLISVFGGLKFWWWYNDFFSIGSLIIISVVTSYLFKNTKIKYIWLPYLSIYILWSFFWINDIYVNQRHSIVPEKTAEAIILDIDKDYGENKKYGIMVFDQASNSRGFEQRYFLEKEGIETYSAKYIEDANYLVIEKGALKNVDAFIFEQFVKLEKIYTEDFSNLNSKVVKSVEVYKVEDVRPHIP